MLTLAFPFGEANLHEGNILPTILASWIRRWLCWTNVYLTLQSAQTKSSLLADIIAGRFIGSVGRADDAVVRREEWTLQTRGVNVAEPREIRNREEEKKNSISLLSYGLLSVCWNNGSPFCNLSGVLRCCSPSLCAGIVAHALICLFSLLYSLFLFGAHLCFALILFHHAFIYSICLPCLNIASYASIYFTVVLILGLNQAQLETVSDLPLSPKF